MAKIFGFYIINAKIELADVMSTMIFYMTDVNVICFTSLGVVGRCYCQGCDGYIAL